MIEALVSPLDAARTALLRLAGRRGRLLLARRSARVAVYAALGIAAALVTSCFAPLWAFAFGPIVFGVAHVLADVRYLVVQPGLHRRAALAFAVGGPLVAGTIDASPAIGLSAGLGAILFARGRRGAPWGVARALLLAAWIGVIVLAARHPRTSALVLLHGHNAIAVALYVIAFARSRLVSACVGVVTVACAVALLGGIFDPIIARCASHGPATGLDFAAVLDTVAPLSDPVLATRLAILFVFAQGVHYVVWLRLVPDDARERPGIRSFASSLGALERDVGRPVLVVFAVFAIVVAAGATLSLEAARSSYLRVAGFHAHLEIAFALLLLLEGRPRRADAPT